MVTLRILSLHQKGTKGVLMSTTKPFSGLKLDLGHLDTGLLKSISLGGKDKKERRGRGTSLRGSRLFNPNDPCALSPLDHFRRRKRRGRQP